MNMISRQRYLTGTNVLKILRSDAKNKVAMIHTTSLVGMVSVDSSLFRLALMDARIIGHINVTIHL